MTEEQLDAEQGFANEWKRGKAKAHFVFVDVLNIISCFAVVCLHTSLGVFSPQRTRLWAFQELMQAVFIFAVPIFFMVSGMNLLDYRKKYSTKVFFKNDSCGWAAR